MKIKTDEEIDRAYKDTFCGEPSESEAFIAGAKWAQDELLESASEGFEEWFNSNNELQTDIDEFNKIDSETAEIIWQSAKLSKDGRIEELEDDLEYFKDKYYEVCENLKCAEDQNHYYKLMCEYRDKYLEDAKLLKEKDERIKELENQLKEAVKDIGVLVTLIDEGCLVYDQYVPSGSSSFRSDAECERSKLKSKYGLDKQEGNG